MNPSSPKLLTNCPMCEAPYEDRSIRLLGEHGTMRMFHLTCPSCSHSLLAVILENQHGVSSLGLVTDMEAQDALRFQDAEAITADDCLQARDEIQKGSRRLCQTLMYGAQGTEHGAGRA